MHAYKTRAAGESSNIPSTWMDNAILQGKAFGNCMFYEIITVNLLVFCAGLFNPARVLTNEIAYFTVVYIKKLPWAARWHQN